MIGDEEVKERVVRLEMGDRMESDHHPVIVCLKGRWDKGRKERKESGKHWREVWDERGREEFRSNWE